MFMETSANDSQVSLMIYMSHSTGTNFPRGTLNSEAFGLRNDGELYYGISASPSLKPIPLAPCAPAPGDRQ